MMFSLFKLIFLLIMILLSVAFLTLLERKVLSYLQKRKGPNKLGMKGILQPFSDAVKLFFKEFFFIYISNYLIYMLSPMLILVLSLVVWFTFPSMLGSMEIGLPIIFILCCLSAGVYPILAAGWASNSKYSMLGSLRAIAQTISYEVSLAFIFLSLVLLVSSYHLLMFMTTMNMPCLMVIFPLSALWFLSALAETNRTPFDFSEGESELVSGFNTEYSASGFVLFFLAEYSSILFMSLLFSVFFFSPKDTISTLSFMMVMIAYMFIWVRGTLPRMRYDKLMMMAWKIFLPFTLSYLILVISISS